MKHLFITFGVNHLNSETRVLERSQLYWTSFNFVHISQHAHTLLPSIPSITETMVFPFRYQQITVTSKAKSDLVSYIPSVSQFLIAIIEGKTPNFFFLLAKQRSDIMARYWQFNAVQTKQYLQISDKEPFLKSSWVLQREIHCKSCRNCLPVEYSSPKGPKCNSTVYMWHLIKCSHCSWGKEQNKS